MNTTLTADIERSIGFLEGLFAHSPLEHVAFRFWNGSAWPDERPRPVTLVLKHPGALREMFGSGTEKGLAEAYLRDDFDITGDIESAFELADALGSRDRDDWLGAVATDFRIHRLPAKPGKSRPFSGMTARLHSPERDRHAVSFHYDLSNDFYQLWLDRRMIYSCAYFELPGNDLDLAQTAKLHHLCRKIRLQPGQRVLDIGCGWGGFAMFAARHYHAQVTGITLSRRQAEHASSLVRQAGLDGNVEIVQRDYRELGEPETYDAIVSVGMSEHVGRKCLEDYFKAAGALLKPDGVFLNHAIGEGVRPRPRHGPSFMDEYIFPDSDVPPICTVLQAAESAGLEVRDVENLREHYALTLRHWVRRLESSHEAALHFVDEPTFRAWRLYLAGSAHGFERAQLAVYQALLSKPDRQGRSCLPLTRRDWYEQP